MRIIDCEQGTEQWHHARLGIPTASEFKTIIGVKKDAREKATRGTYMRRLAGEIITGQPAESYQNQHMERGKIMEDEARAFYALSRDVEPQRVGFIQNGRTGCSPDSLLEASGGLEIKTALPHIQIERIEKDELPPEHRAQVQGSIWLAEREYWDFVSYWPRLPMLVVRVHRDDGYIATLAGAVKQFNEELDELVERVRRYGQPSSSIPADLLMAG